MDRLVFERLFQGVRKMIRKNLPPIETTDVVDSDVGDETEKIKKMTNVEMKKANLALQGLSKCYGNNLAVNQLYLGVNTSECFGLLV